MKPLELPPTIRTARPDEVPGNQPDILQRIEESRSAIITEGYVFHYNDTDDRSFKFFAEINVDNSRLWSLFKTLLLQLPEEISVVANHKDGEPRYSQYADKYEVLNKLERCELELTQDGLLEAGVLFNDDSFLEEVFIKATKYLQYWGMDETRFKETMAAFDLAEVPGLNFIDEFPLATEALHMHHPQAVPTQNVLVILALIGVK